MNNGEIGKCVHCATTELLTALVPLQTGHLACRKCADTYYSACDNCAGLVRSLSRNFRTVSGIGRVCYQCLGNSFHWCTVCQAYYHSDRQYDDHLHTDEYADSCCSSPQPSFRVPLGDGFLASDVRASVEMSNEISREALVEIRNVVLRDPSPGAMAFAWKSLDEVSREWVTSEGTFPKRAARKAYNRHGYKIPTEHLTEIGNIARANSGGAVFNVEVTRKLNMPARAFVNDGSCWWGGYSESRCAFKTNGGFALRSFSSGQLRPSGRMWVMPLNLSPGRRRLFTFETETPSAYLVFNGYGDLSDGKGVRLLAQMAGLSYYKTSVYLSPMFINGDSGFIVTDTAKWHDIVIDKRLPTHSNLFSEEMEMKHRRLSLSVTWQIALASLSVSENVLRKRKSA